MKFTMVDTTEAYAAIRYLSEGQRWELGITRMIYGYQVSFNLNGDNGYEKRYCCGALEIQALLVLSIVMGYLSRFDESVSVKEILRYMPSQRVKPIQLDRELMIWLTDLANPDIPLEVKPPLPEWEWTNERIQFSKEMKEAGFYSG